MKKVLEMREKRAKAWDAAKAFLDTRAKEGVLSAEDNATYDKMLADVDSMARQIALEEDRVARDTAMAQPTSSPIMAKPNAQDGKPVHFRATAEYREDFLNLVRGKRPVHNVMEEGTPSTGGYLVPIEFDRNLVRALERENVIRSISKVITTAAPHRINVALTDVSADWVVESGTFTPSTPTFNQLSLDAYTLRAAALVSEELLQDSMAGDKDLALAYAICLDDGIAKIYKRKFPAGLEYPWEYQWTLGPAADVAIEFNGVWKMNAAKEWYYLQTEEYPYIFYVRGGNLYVQLWRDSESNALLATGVSQISACKGWQSSVDRDLDQGLVIGYLKAGRVYYRAFCCQDNGSYVWEAEHEVATLGSGNSTLSVIRTNDFRIGFLTQNGGRMRLALTHRNYAGMSVRPETVHANASRVKMWVSGIHEINTLNRELASASIAYPYVLLDVPGSEEISVVSVEKLNRTEVFYCYGFKIRLSKPLHGTIDAGFPAKCALSISSVTITSASYDSEEQALILYTSADIRRTAPVTITMPEYRALWYRKPDSQRWFLPALTAFAAAETIDYYVYENETAGISLASAETWIDEAVFSWYYQSPCTAVIGVAASSVTLQPVSTLPI